MKALIIICPEKKGLSFAETGTISTVISLKKREFIQDLEILCLSTQPYSLQYAKSLGIPKGIWIQTSSKNTFDQAMLIKPYTKNIHCIFLHNQSSIYGHLGQILAGLLNWQHISSETEEYSSFLENPSTLNRSIVSLNSTQPAYPSITNILHTPLSHLPTNKAFLKTCTELKKTNRIPLQKISKTPQEFIQQLLNSGLLQ